MRCPATLYACLLLTAVSAQELTSKCGEAEVVEKEFTVNGATYMYRSFPWHVDIPVRHWSKYEVMINSGILVSPSLVISSANWFFDEGSGTVINASATEVVAGKYNCYNASKPQAQTSLVKRIDIPKGYKGQSGHFAHNIALLHLVTPFNITMWVMPMCIDWDNMFENESLRRGKSEKSLGSSDKNENHEINLHYIPHEECLSQAEQEDKSRITANTFCMDHCSNETRLCGKYGHGEGFGCQAHGRWYLLGVLSLGDRHRDCSFKRNTVYTNVGRYLDWIRAAFVKAE